MDTYDTNENGLGASITEACLQQGGPVMFEARLAPSETNTARIEVNIIGTWKTVETMCLKANGILCFVCGAPTAQRCGTCNTTGYCSNACQKQDWTRHKSICFKNTQDLLFQKKKRQRTRGGQKRSSRGPQAVAVSSAKFR